MNDLVDKRNTELTAEEKQRKILRNGSVLFGCAAIILLILFLSIPRPEPPPPVDINYYTIFCDTAQEKPLPATKYESPEVLFVKGSKIYIRASSGASNVFVGSGIYNTAIGYQAGHNLSGNHNVAIGRQTLRILTTKDKSDE